MKKISNSYFTNRHIRRRAQRGATLVEMGIVLAIIAVLVAGASYLGLGDTMSSARSTGMATQIRTAETAVDLVQAQTGCWPNSIDFMITVRASNNSCALDQTSMPTWKGPYLRGVDMRGITLSLERVQSGAYAVISTVGVRSLEVYGPDEPIGDLAESMCGKSLADLPTAVSATDQCAVDSFGSNQRVLKRFMSNL